MIQKSATQAGGVVSVERSGDSDGFDAILDGDWMKVRAN